MSSRHAESGQPASPPQPIAGGAKGWVINLVVMLATFAIMLGLFEAGLRIAGFSYPLFPEKIQFGAPNPEKIQSDFQPDETLFWVPKDYYTRLADIGTTGVVFMGDSCTQNGTYPQALSELLRSRMPGKDFSYASLGVTGWSSYQGLQQLKRDVIKLKPKAITVYYGWNDHWIGFGIEDKLVGSINRSLLYRVRNVRLVQLVQKAGVVLTQSSSGFPKRVSPEDFENNLREICRVAKANGIVPVLLTAPSSHEAGREPASLTTRWIEQLDSLLPMHIEYVEIVRRVAHTEGAVLCDLAKEFEAMPRDVVRRDYFREDGIHFYGEGDRAIATCLYRCFEEAGLWEQVARDAAEVRQFPQNIERLKKDKLQKGVANPGLPTRIEVESIDRDPANILAIRGYVLSPAIIDYIVVYITGENMGSARYPEVRPDIEARFPEYADPYAGFTFERRDPAPGNEGKIEVYSGSELLTSISFTLDET